jgi:hypothetical protein
MQRQLLKYFLFVLLGLSRRLFVFPLKVELKDVKWLFSLENFLGEISTNLTIRDSSK